MMAQSCSASALGAFGRHAGSAYLRGRVHEQRAGALLVLVSSVWVLVRLGSVGEC
jgi:hypothetical protein